jgi:hypothetical protein
MPFAFRLADYARYREQVNGATYIDLTRRSDPACHRQCWDNLRQAVAAYGQPWVLQVWTKDIAGVLCLGADMLRALREVGTTITAQVTVTGLAGTLWEPLAPPDGLRLVPELARMIGGPNHIKWRYDPIIPALHSAERFRVLARRAAEMGLTQGVINFVAPPGRYARVDRRLGPLLPGWVEGMPGYTPAWQERAECSTFRVARELVALAGEAGITLSCCAEGAALAERVPGLRRAACGEYEWFVALSGQAPLRVPFKGSRPGCGCARYFDVGNYGSWSRCHRCVYCYAG